MNKYKVTLIIKVNREDEEDIDVAISDAIYETNAELINISDYMLYESDESATSITYRDESKPNGRDITPRELIDLLAFISSEEQNGKTIKEVRPFGNDEGITIIMDRS